MSLDWIKYRNNYQSLPALVFFSSIRLEASSAVPEEVISGISLVPSIMQLSVGKKS